MTRVILQPTAQEEDRKNYQHTVENPVSLSRIKPHLETDLYKKLSTVIDADSTCVWGIKPTHKSQWDKIHKGDKVIFARDNRYFSLSTLTARINSYSLALDLWGFANRESRDTWEFVYFFGPPIDIAIPCKDINPLVPEIEPGSVPQQITVLSLDKANAVIEILKDASN